MNVLKINGVVCTEENYKLLVNKLISADTFALRCREQEEEIQYNFERETYIASSILLDSVYNIQGKNIGYVALHLFNSTTTEEVYNAVSKFGDKKIQELIIDIRYNGGGLVSSMEDVANFIASDRTKGKIMYSDKRNDRYKIFNSTTYFDDTPQY